MVDYRNILGDVTSAIEFYRKLEDEGYEIVEAKTTVMPLEIVLGLAPSNLLMRAVSGLVAAFTFLLPRVFGYQFVFLARPKK